MNLDRVIENHIDSVPMPELLRKAYRHSFLAPNKKLIRPRMLVAFSELLDLSHDVSVPVAVGLEIAHASMLVQDDLPCFDNATERRGSKANHLVFGEDVASVVSVSGQFFGLSLFRKARPQVKPENYINALERFIEVVGPSGVGGAQILERTHCANLADLLHLHEVKTALMFETCAVLPLLLAGKTDTAMKEFAFSFGKAFQIADDLDDRDDRKNNIALYEEPRKAKERALTDLLWRYGQFKGKHSHQEIDLMVEKLKTKLQ
jgi:geranylgeranyl pyrophosphate synthase